MEGIDSHRAPQAIGKAVILDGIDFTIIGVPLRDFVSGVTQIFIRRWGRVSLCTMTIAPSIGINGIARMRPGVTIGQAEAEMTAVQENLDRLYPVADRNLGIDIVPLKQMIVGDTGRTLLLLLGAVGIVLLIACTMPPTPCLLAQPRGQRVCHLHRAGGERCAHGAAVNDRNCSLAIAGGVLGLGLAKLGIRPGAGNVCPRACHVPEYRGESSRPVVRVSAFRWRLELFSVSHPHSRARAGLQGSLKTGDRGSTRAQGRGQSILVIAQMALTLVLLVGAGLLVRTHPAFVERQPGL